MNITIINDCRDENAAGRQKIRTAELFGGAPNFIGTSSELEAAGNLIDALDALDGTEGIILVNVAPRHGTAKKWENGTPFGYFRYKNALVISTVDGLVLSLVKKLRLVEEINVLDTAQAVDVMVRNNFIPDSFREHIIKSQFRSFDFLPRIAAYLYKTNSELGESVSIDSISTAPSAVWYIDNFGNCKTTLFLEDMPTKFGQLRYYERLKDVPHGEPAVIIGSSGIEQKRFLEIVVQGENAAKTFDLAVGSEIK